MASQGLIDIVRGDRLRMRRVVTNVPPGILITKAWLTVKYNLADPDPGVFQKEVTAAEQPDVGRITDPGADGTAVIDFVLTEADTLSLDASSSYWYDIQVRTSQGDLITLEHGRVTVTEQVTQSS